MEQLASPNEYFYLQVKNTYYVAKGDDLPGPGHALTPDHNAGEEIAYYQWVPLMLTAMLIPYVLTGEATLKGLPTSEVRSED